MNYIIKFELMNPRNQKIESFSTLSYPTESEAMKEYTIEATKRTTFGLMEIIFAELLQYEKDSTTPINVTTIVDWRNKNNNENVAI